MQQIHPHYHSMNHLYPRPTSHYGPEIRDSYNAELRRRHLKRQLAWLAVIMAMATLSAGFCVMLDAVNSHLFSAIAANLVIAGIWAGHYLLTRH